MHSMFRAGAAVLFLALAAFVSPAAAIDVKVVTSPGGIAAWFVEDRTAPVIHMSFAFRPGAMRDPAEKEGTGNMTAALLDEGAGELDALAYQRRMQDLAMGFWIDAQRDVISATVRTLARNQTEVFRHLSLALTKPRFDAQPIERTRAQIEAHLKRELRDPDTIAHRALLKQMFPSHPYGRSTQGTLESIARITKDDLHAFHRAAFAKDNLTVGVIGDISPTELGALLDIAFGDLPQRTSPVAIRETAPEANGAVSVRRLQVPQSVAVFGHSGLKRKDPDYFAAMVTNHILGGGTFSSRLYSEVREKRGLAYSVGSYLNPLDHSALIMGSVATENRRVKESIDIIRAEWRRLAAGEVTAAEVASAKIYITGSFALRFASASSIARMLVNIQIDGEQPDYFKKRNGFVEAVTLDDVKRVAARLLQPDKLTFVVVGDPAGM